MSPSPVSFDVKNLQTRCKFAGERDFPIKKLLYGSSSMSESQQGSEISDIIYIVRTKSYTVDSVLTDTSIRRTPL